MGIAQRLCVALLTSGLSLAAAGQADSTKSEFPVAGELAATTPPGTDSPQPRHAVQVLQGFKDSDVKFRLDDLMEILRDRRHEGWVLAAYPDPKTGRPLIGAGFSLDLPEREHPQGDAANPHPFLEPSSAELWQASGLSPDRLDAILAQFHDRMAAWTKKKFRRRIATLEPEISENESTLLLRIAVIQAVYNAKAYCRVFDQLTASQQMALTQLVYQMGVNLQEFSQFLELVNSDHKQDDAGINAGSPHGGATESEYWKRVQSSLVQSQWARFYRSRAISVIAMFDPLYTENPTVAERRVSATLRPLAHGRARKSAARRVAGDANAGKSMGRRPGGRRARRRA